MAALFLWFVVTGAVVLQLCPLDYQKPFTLAATQLPRNFPQ